MGNVGVFIQHKKGNIQNVSLELLSKAQDLAKTLSVEVSCYIPCEKEYKMVDTVSSYGAKNVYLIKDKNLEHFTSSSFSKAVCEAINKDKPSVVLFGATKMGRDLAPRVASTLKAGLTADCTELKIGEFKDNFTKKEYKNLLYQIRPAFGGNIVATIINPENHPQMATVREGVMKLKDPLKGAKAKVIDVEVNLDSKDLAVKLIKEIVKEKKVNLTGENIIVAGGMGVGSKENFKLLKELADVLGGELGASRAAVDQGWVSKDYQVGQTGVTVRPKLYVACGISGSIQHKAGMDESLKIIAINNDPSAPIFDFADIKIVGDLKEVIPMVIDSYKKLEK